MKLGEEMNLIFLSKSDPLGTNSEPYNNVVYRGPT